MMNYVKDRLASVVIEQMEIFVSRGQAATEVGTRNSNTILSDSIAFTQGPIHQSKVIFRRESHGTKIQICTLFR